MTAFYEALRAATFTERSELIATMLKAISSHEGGNRYGRVRTSGEQAATQGITLPDGTTSRSTIEFYRQGLMSKASAI